jgi:glucosamine--fructose-6-phosphate aminotransferase (isomerizing)
VSVELASEYRYRDPVVSRDHLIIGMSQSGETADTLAVLREMKRRGVPTVSVTNVRGSTISRESDATFYTSAGPEIGVAATKTFTCQMLMLLLWAGYLGLKRGNGTSASVIRAFEELVKLPHLLEEYLDEKGEMVQTIRQAAKSLLKAKGFFFIGRGYSFPVALEGALKLKEIAYVHAEGYAAGELKHGPIAMIDKDMVVVVLAPHDTWHDKTVSNLEEVKARGAMIFGVGSSADHSLKSLCDFWAPLPYTLDESLMPFILTPVIQLLSYELAVLKGTDVDKPRNLAKSVTVE